MAAQTRRDLFLSVSADVTNLSNQMKAGRSALLSLGGAANDVKAAVEKALIDMGANAPAQAKQISASYTATFNEIRRNMESLRDAGSGSQALGILNANGAQAAAAAAERSAAALRIDADAAALVAERHGEAGAAARLLAVALETQAQEALKSAVALRSQAELLGEVAIEARGLGAAEDDVSQAHNRVGTSGLIADHVIRAFSDSIAAGQSPVRAFALELPRVVEAMQFMAAQTGATEGAMAKFAGFMGGPLGIAVTLGLTALSPLIAGLFESEDAAKHAQSGAEGLAAVESALGKMFDLTTGRMHANTEAMRLNTEAAIVNTIAQARQRQQAARAVLDPADRTPGLARQALGSVQIGIGGLFSDSAARAGARNVTGNLDVQALRQEYARVANLTDPHQRELAERRLMQRTLITDFTGSGTTAEGFVNAIRDARAPEDDRAGAYAAERSLNSGVLDPSLRRYTRPRKLKTDHTQEREANADRAYQAELSTAQQRLAKARLALADTAENRYHVEVDELDAAKRQRDLEIDDQVTAHKISATQAQQLHALNDQATAAERTAALRKEQQAILDRQLEADRRQIDGQLAVANLQADLATTAALRRATGLRLLALEEEQARKAAQRDIASNDPDRQASGRDALALIDAEHPYRVEQRKRETAGPLEAYRNEVKAATDDMHEALQGVAVDGLKGIEDGFVGIVSGTETVASAFKKMASSIIADLARIAIEKLIVKAIGGGLFGFAGGGAVDGHAIGGFITGPGSGTSDSILARLSNGEFVINAAATAKHLPLLSAINDNRLPGFAGGGLIGYPSLPSPTSLARNDNQPMQIQLVVRKGEAFAAEVIGVSGPHTVSIVQAAAPALVDASTTATIARLRQPSL